MLFVLLGMFTVPWILNKVTAFNLERASNTISAKSDVVGQNAVNNRQKMRAKVAEPASETLAEGQLLGPYYAPDVNLEREDVTVLASGENHIDAALYSATDRAVCDALAEKARKGVSVRVYRDREQYQEEESRARGRETCVEELVASGAAVKIKASTELMHLKAYMVDGRILRTGSANISEGGEKWQDNDVVFIGSTIAAKAFEDKFEQMWDRTDNQVVGRR
jgi:phosphatidylserine/phosphatidylglycerophosphate/cardiolipin synthase-like enzyme